jgi:hypothetical protein
MVLKSEGVGAPRLRSPLLPEGTTTLLAKVSLWLAFAVLGAWIVVGWIRDARPPVRPLDSPAPRAKVDLTAAIDEAASAGLFGLALVESPAAAPGIDIKLKGVFAGEGERIGAIVNTGGQDRFVEVGREIGPNVRLAAVRPSYIVVDRSGITHRVEIGRLESGSARRAATPPGATPPPAPTAPENPPPPAPGETAPFAHPAPPAIPSPAPGESPDGAAPSGQPAPLSALTRAVGPG